MLVYYAVKFISCSRGGCEMLRRMNAAVVTYSFCVSSEMEMIAEGTSFIEKMMMITCVNPGNAADFQH